MAIDYTRNELDVLIALIRQDNGNKPLSASQVTFGNPNVMTAQPNVNRNTLVVATAIADRGYSGSQTFYYNRLPLSVFIDEDTMSKTFKITKEKLLSELLPEINRRYKINLTVDKIVDKALPSFEDDTRAYVDLELKASPMSLVYLDSIVLRIEPEVVALKAAVAQTQLTGLTYDPSRA